MIYRLIPKINILIVKIIVSLLFLTLSIKLFCQVQTSSIFRLHSLAKDKGLFEATNDFIYKDKFGFVWISSLEGLNRYDGSHVKVYTPKVNDINSLNDSNIQSPFFENKEGDIWFTSLHSIQVYNHNKGYFNKFFINFKGNVFNKVEYTAFYLEQNRWLWVKASDSLFRFDTKAPPHYKRDNAIFLHKLQAARFAVDTYPNGQVRRVVACYWAYQKGVEVIDYDINQQVKSRKSYFTGEKNSKQPPLTIKKAIIENDTLIWLSSREGLVALNPQKPSFFQVFPLKQEGITLQSIGVLPNRQIFISTSDATFLSLDKENNKFTPLSIQSKKGEPVDKIMPNGAQAVYLDRSNMLWFSAYKQGVYFSQSNYNIFKNIKLNENSPIDIEHISESLDSNIIINYIKKETSGVLLTQTGKPIYFNRLPKNSRFLKTHKGDLWNISRLGHIQLWDKASNQFKTILKDTILFNDAIVNTENTFLLATNNGIYFLDFEKNIYKPLALNQYFVERICTDYKDRLWIGTADGKLICFDKINDKKPQIVKQISDIDVLSHFHASKFTPTVLWVATAKGIVKINTEILTDTLFSEQDGLPSNYIQSVLEDKKGNLWCGTNQGLVRYNPVSKKAKLYTKRQGLSSDSYNRGAALLSSTGEMWFGGNNGVDVFHPDSIKDIGHAPQSAIVGLKIFDDYWKGDTAIEVATQVKLKHFQNTLTLELAAMEYTDPENNLFKVALVTEGDSTKWTDLGTQNHVTFPNLREGRYTFKLLTANSEGDWNTIPKTLIIDITPPYWRRWWFLTLVVLASIGLISYIVYLRLSKIIELQGIRLKLYENLHDDIGSRLTAIVMMVEQMLHTSKQNDPTLPKISDISKSIVGNMRRLVWATAPENDALKNIVDKMREDKRVLLPEHIAFTVDMDKSLQTLTITGDKRYQMLSVFNEALTNINKYAAATKVTVALSVAADNLTMVIQDNGKGFDMNAPRTDKENSSGYGLRNMQKRANRIKGALNINSIVGQGTIITFTFPLKDSHFLQRYREYFSKSI